MICSHQDEERPPDQADFQGLFLGELFIVRLSIELCRLYVTNFLVFRSQVVYQGREYYGQLSFPRESLEFVYFHCHFMHGVVASLVLRLAGTTSKRSAFAVCLSPHCYPIGKICTSQCLFLSQVRFPYCYLSINFCLATSICHREKCL